MNHQQRSQGKALPYWRLSFFYFSYFAVLGALAPYWGLYLKEVGFDAVAIGQLMAILAGTKIIAPNLWGWLADKTQQRMRILRLGAFSTLLFFSFVFYSEQFWWVALVMAGFSFFWNAILPQMEVVTLNHLAEPQTIDRYSLIRLWGSIGFIVVVVGGGVLFDYVSVRALPWLLLGLMACIWVSSLLFDDKPSYLGLAHGASFLGVLKKTEVWVFFVTCFLMQVSHGPYYTFFSLYLEGIGYSRTAIGWLWALGVIAEVIVFMMVHFILRGIGARKLVLLSLFLGGVRWLMTGYLADNLALLIVAQCLHAATFGTFHAAAIHIVHRNFTGANAGQGQALYSSVSYGVGGAVGALVSGYLWDAVDHYVTFVCASVSCFIAFALAHRLLKME